jgi:hypothetical protein
MVTSAFVVMGGPQLNAIKDIQIEGTLLSTDGAGTIGTFIARARGEDWSLDTTRRSTTASFRVLKGRGSTRKDDAIKSLSPSTTEGLRLDVFPLLGRWTEFKEPGAQVTLVGESTIDGTNCYQIHVRSGRGSPDPTRANHHGEVDVYIDPVSGLIIAIRYKATAGAPVPKQVLIENHFKHYEHFGQFLIPTDIQRTVAGAPTASFHITGVFTNNGFTDADFQN